jgi:hypothetical protein
MIYPARGSFLNQTRKDTAVAAALRKIMPALLTDAIDTCFAQLFDEATQILRAGDGAARSFAADPIAFVKWVQTTRPALKLWAGDLSPNYFVLLFVALCAARQKWHDNRRPPFDVEEHCKVARAIDAFHEFGGLDWTGPAVAYWLLRAGVVGKNTRGRDNDAAGDETDTSQNGEGGKDKTPAEDGSDEDSLFVKQESPAPKLEVRQEGKVEITDLHSMMQRAKEEAWRQYCLNIDMEAMQQAFEKLRVERPVWSFARRKSRHPFLDDSEDDSGDVEMKTD